MINSMINLIQKYSILLVLFVISIANAQEKKQENKQENRQEKNAIKTDTIIKTEVVNVVTSYVPKITDAFKIKQKPQIEHTKETQKKALEYTIFSVPVASTFIPKSGVMKKIDLGKKEEFYPNYFALGFANKMTPFFEASIRKNENYDSEFGADLKFLLSSNPIENSQLNSTYYTMGLKLFYTQYERYYNWKAGINASRNKHNWYGLPENISFTDATISRIEPEQAYNSIHVFGEVIFDDSFISSANTKVSLFSDILSSSEFEFDADATFKFPLDVIYRDLNDLEIKTTLTYLGTKFEKSYLKSTTNSNNSNNSDGLKHSFFTFGIHPSYEFLAHDISVKIGAKTYFSMDIENSQNNIFVYPDVEISYPIVKEYLTIFLGASGDLKTNSYQSLANENPYISPTQKLLQTNEKYNAFAGFRGKLPNQFSYHLKASYADIENNAFSSIQQSKSNGKNIAGTDAFSFLGYDYGNSFNTEYDDITKVSFFGELAFDGFKNMSLGINGQFNQFTLTNELAPWNTPEIKGEFFATYKTHKWYAGTNLFFVGERKAKEYNVIPETTFKTIDLESYFDINLNGGYHISDSFSVFLHLNNILNTDYQRFNNFNVQGFQAMGGLSWKFDALF